MVRPGVTQSVVGGGIGRIKRGLAGVVDAHAPAMDDARTSRNGGYSGMVGLPMGGIWGNGQWVIPL